MDEMTPERAREIWDKYEGFRWEDSSDAYFAKGFLAGIEYEREASKGLVEALKYYRDLDNGKRPENLPQGCVIPFAQAALAAYKARTERK